MARDMTQAEFDAACERHGFRPSGYLGYYTIWEGEHGGTCMVSILNAGPRRRDQLAYLIRQRQKREKEAPATP